MAKQSICKISGCDNPIQIKSRGWCDKHYRRWKRNGDPTVLKVTPKGEPLAWLKRHAKHVGHDCLEWPYSKMGGGYGHLSIEGKFQSASRLMCILAHGEAPSEIHQSAHSCHNPPCVNPNHLRWATPVENVQDRIDADRMLLGAKCPSSFLTDDVVLKIRRIVKSGVMQQKDVAEMLGLTRQHVSEIVLRKIWKHLP